jgi:hypothetical protein
VGLGSELLLLRLIAGLLWGGRLRPACEGGRKEAPGVSNRAGGGGDRGRLPRSFATVRWASSPGAKDGCGEAALPSLLGLERSSLALLSLALLARLPLPECCASGVRSAPRELATWGVAGSAAGELQKSWGTDRGCSTEPSALIASAAKQLCWWASSSTFMKRPSAD